MAKYNSICTASNDFCENCCWHKEECANPKPPFYV